MALFRPIRYRKCFILGSTATKCKLIPHFINFSNPAHPFTRNVTSPRLSTPVSKNNHSCPINGLQLATYGPTYADDYALPQSKKKIIEFVLHLVIEEEARVVSGHENEEGEKEGEDFFEGQIVPEVFYKKYKKE